MDSRYYFCKACRKRIYKRDASGNRVIAQTCKCGKTVFPNGLSHKSIEQDIRDGQFRRPLIKSKDADIVH